MRTEIVPGIIADSDIAFGKPVISGTRVPAAVIIGQLAAGIPESELCAEYEHTTDVCCHWFWYFYR